MSRTKVDDTDSMKGKVQFKKNWVEEGRSNSEIDQPAEIDPAPGQVALRPYSDSLIR